MKPKYEKALFLSFRDDLNKRSKNVVFKHTVMIIEEKYPELHKEVKYLIDRNLEKEAPPEESCFTNYFMDKGIVSLLR